MASPFYRKYTKKKNKSSQDSSETVKGGICEAEK